MAIHTVCLRNWPNLDSVVAYTIFQEVAKRPLTVTFRSRNAILTDDDIAYMGENGVIPIGVGKERTYDCMITDLGNDAGFGSETGFLVDSLRLQGGLPVDDESLDKLVVWIDQDNVNGQLTKKQRYSVGWILHQAFRLGYDHQDAVSRGSHVVRVLIDCMRARIGVRPDLGLREKAMNSSAMALMPKGDYFGPLTVRRYIRDMYILGYDEKEIVAKAWYLIEIHEKAKKREAAAKKVAETAKFDSFLLSRRQEFGTWVESDDPYFVNRLGQDRDLVVRRNSKGNIIMMSREFDLSDVAAAFVEKEPDLWYFDEDRNILANGTESEPAPATALGRESIQICVAMRVKRRRN